jgi:hypothetical protein
LGLRKFSKILIFVGFSLLFGALGWWGAFYGEVVLASGAAAGDPSILLPCLYAKFGVCGFTEELSQYSLAISALWLTAAILGLGLVLRAVPERTPTSIIPTLVHREPIAAMPQLSATPDAPAGIQTVTADGKSGGEIKRAVVGKQPQRQMRANTAFPTTNRYGPTRSVASVESYAYMDTGRSNVGVIGLALVAAIGATVGLQVAFPSMSQIEELAPPGTLAVRSVTLAEFPKPVTVLTRGQIFRDLQYSARGELRGEDQSYFVTLSNAKVAVVDSRSGDLRTLLEIYNGHVHQFVVTRRFGGEIVLADSVKGTNLSYEPAISFSPSEERIALKAIDPRSGESLVVMDLETGAKHTIAQPEFPKAKKAQPVRRNSSIFLETMRWLSEEEVQYLEAFECVETQKGTQKSKTKGKCQAGQIELFAIRAQTAGAVIEAKKVASFEKPADISLQDFVSEQFRARLAAYDAMLGDVSKQKSADLKLLAESMSMFAQKRSLDATDPFSQDVLLALFQEPTA